MAIRTVVDEDECKAACIENSECRSVNLKTTPDESAKHTCELLDTDKFASDHDEEFDASLDFNHYSFTVGLFQKSYIIIYRGIFATKRRGREIFFFISGKLN